MKPPATSQKLRGGYYTPRAIGEFLSTWAIRDPHDRILEPSCGDGELLLAASQALQQCGATPLQISQQLHGIELDPAEADKARARLGDLGPIVQSGDFFQQAAEWLPDAEHRSRAFDVVLGNPPFIRYQNFDEDQRHLAFRLMQRAGLRPSRLTNAWVPFVCVATQLLRPSGRLALVLPAELLQVGYTAELRQFLAAQFRRLILITFRELVFPNIQQEVVLLCAEKGGGSGRGMHLVELDGVADLAAKQQEILNHQLWKPVDPTTDKWTQYYLTKNEIALVRKLRAEPRLQRLGTVASVDVGMVTGLNEFFVLTEAARKCAKLNGFTRPMVTRSGHLGGLRFSTADWEGLVQAGQASHLLNAPSVPFAKLPRAVQNYVKAGEARAAHRGYKCRIRKLWYVVPSFWVPDAFLLRQIHRFPKLILNKSPATCTDTIHRVRFHPGVNGQQVTMAALNSLTFAFAELLGRSYGGGVLELEPREAEQLPIPLGGSERLDADELHQLLCKQEVDAALEITDRHLLKIGLGLSDKEVRALRGIWIKLRERRLQRRHVRA